MHTQAIHEDPAHALGLHAQVLMLRMPQQAAAIVMQLVHVVSHRVRRARARTTWSVMCAALPHRWQGCRSVSLTQGRRNRRAQLSLQGRPMDCLWGKKNVAAAAVAACHAQRQAIWVPARMDHQTGPAHYASHKTTATPALHALQFLAVPAIERLEPCSKGHSVGTAQAAWVLRQGCAQVMQDTSRGLCKAPTHRSRCSCVGTRIACQVGWNVFTLSLFHLFVYLSVLLLVWCVIATGIKSQFWALFDIESAVGVFEGLWRKGLNILRMPSTPPQFQVQQPNLQHLFSEREG